MNTNVFSRWMVVAILLGAGLAAPSPLSAQISALRQSMQSTQPIASPPAGSGLAPAPGNAGQPNNAPLASNLAPLQGILLYGIEDLYRGSGLPDGSYRLESRSDNDSVKFFYSDNPPDTYGRRSVVANLKVDGRGAAGLIYGYQKDPTRYFLILVDAEKNLRILERGPDGFAEMLSMSTDGGVVQELKLLENGSEVSVSLNGQNLLSLSNDHTGVGAVGVATLGAGTFEFQKFEVLIHQR